MKTKILGALLCAVGLPFAAGHAAELKWLTDYNAALKEAKAENKVLFLDFTGSDWCGWCIKLKAEVFDTPEFAAFARANLVLVEVDFPRGKKLPEAQQRANAALQARFKPEGFPTLYLVGHDDRLLSELGYIPGGPGPFLDTLKKTAAVKWQEPLTGKTATAGPTSKTAAPTPAAVTVTFPASRYDELQLSGLSGPASQRLAIINNQTFAAGETARVKLKDGAVLVQCREIRAKSVIVQAEGAAEAKELFLNTN